MALSSVIDRREDLMVENNHADLRFIIEHIDKRVEMLAGKIDSIRPCLMTRSDCDKRHQNVVDRRYFVGFGGGALFLSALLSVVIKLM